MHDARSSAEVQKLELSDKDWERYMRQLRCAPPQQHADLRAGRRLPKIVQCVLRVVHGREAHTYVIHSRDIGDGGMGFLHNAPLPHHADCTVVLETNSGHAHIVHGRVRWSREVGGGMHAIGVVFERALDLSRFADVAESGPRDAHPHAGTGGEAYAA